MWEHLGGGGHTTATTAPRKEKSLRVERNFDLKIGATRNTGNPGGGGDHSHRPGWGWGEGWPTTPHPPPVSTEVPLGNHSRGALTKDVWCEVILPI